MVSFVPQEHPHDLAARLGDSGVAVRAGLLCAPVAMATYGVAATGVVRFSFGAMTTQEDIERLIPLL
jgi:selenocysteine lyase/cysteine desulfurase